MTLVTAVSFLLASSVALAEDTPSVALRIPGVPDSAVTVSS